MNRVPEIEEVTTTTVDEEETFFTRGSRYDDENVSVANHISSTRGIPEEDHHDETTPPRPSYKKARQWPQHQQEESLGIAASTDSRNLTEPSATIVERRKKKHFRCHIGTTCFLLLCLAIAAAVLAIVLSRTKGGTEWLGQRSSSDLAGQSDLPSVGDEHPCRPPPPHRHHDRPPPHHHLRGRHQQDCSRQQDRGDEKEGADCRGKRQERGKGSPIFGPDGDVSRDKGQETIDAPDPPDVFVQDRQGDAATDASTDQNP